MRNLSLLTENFQTHNPYKSISDHMISKWISKRRNTKKYKKLKTQSLNIFNKKESLLATHKKCGHAEIEIFKKEHTRLFRPETTVMSQKQTLHCCIDVYKRALTYLCECEEFHRFSFFPIENQ